MDDSSPTQKQRAERYAGNLGYFRRPHYLRRLRLWFFIAAVLLSVGAVITYRYWGRDEIFSKGPLSLGHVQLAHDCRACHSDGQPDALRARLSESHDGRSIPAIVRTIFTPKTLGKDSPHAQAPASPAMDQACLGCHPAFGLHLPQTAGFTLRTVSSESVTVHAENCFICHREHEGRARMALPDANQCASCHNDLSKLSHHRQSVPLKNPPIVPTGENRDLGDGVISFITPPAAPGKPVAFSDFANGHPSFAYEGAGLSDPAAIKFNHARHLRPDLSGAGKDRPLNCTDCHTPGERGDFKQPITYGRHCQQCHSLQLLPSLPKLRIPHGDAEKVRWFLASVRLPIENALRAESRTSPDDLAKRADTEMDALRSRGLRTLAELEQRVFFEGDPKDDPDNRRMRAGNAKFLTECAKCHTVAPATTDHAPEVSPPNMAMRWLQRGQFTHQPHQDMACVDCHGAALKSKLTSDILLPSQKSCAACHRAPQARSMPGGGHRSPNSNETPNAQSLSSVQRERGGVKWDCQACHVFHSPVAPEPADEKRAEKVSPVRPKTPAH